MVKVHLEFTWWDEGGGVGVKLHIEFKWWDERGGGGQASLRILVEAVL